jgi:hypothetical protein
VKSKCRDLLLVTTSKPPGPGRFLPGQTKPANDSSHGRRESLLPLQRDLNCGLDPTRSSGLHMSLPITQSDSHQLPRVIEDTWPQPADPGTRSHPLALHQGRLGTFDHTRFPIDNSLRVLRTLGTQGIGSPHRSGGSSPHNATQEASAESALRERRAPQAAGP